MAGFSASMLRAERELRLRGAVRYAVGTEYELAPEDFVSVNISEGIDTGILPGAVLSAACTIVMNNEDGRFGTGGARRGHAEMKGAEIELRIEVKNNAGEWLFGPMGVYYVDEARGEVNSPAVTLECHDGIYHRTGVKFEDTLSYPCRVKDVFTAAAAQAGFSHDGSGIDDGLVLDVKPRWDDDATVRDVLGYAAALAGGCVMADRWGYLALRKLAGERTAYSIYPETYMARSFREGHFGPVNRLKICTVNGPEDGDSEAETMEFAADVGYGECALEVLTNPLFVTGAAGARKLGESMMEAVGGLEYARCVFSWRGDPDIMPGRYIRLVGVDGGETFCTVSRQTLVFDGGFHAECVCGVPGDGEIKRNALGWSGKMSAGDIVGTVSGANIAADSITARKIAAGAVNADKIAAGAVTAEKIDAGAINAKHIAAGAVTAEKVDAEAISAKHIAAGAVTADKVDAGAITSEKIDAGAITTKHIAAGTVTAESGIIANGAIGTAQIADGSITSAKVVDLSADVIKTGTLSAERLLLVGDDSVIYKINAASSGLSLTELSEDQYKHYINGTVIVAKSITAAQIAAQTITGNEILAGSITAKEIDVSDLFASQATINALNAMDISGNTYLKLMVDNVQVGGTNMLSSRQGAVSVRGGYIDYGWGISAHCQSGVGIGISPDTTGLNYMGAYYEETMALSPGEYMLSFWCWTADADVQPVIRCNLFKNGSIDQYFGDVEVPAANPRRFEVPVTVDFTDSVHLRLYTWTKFTTGRLYISDVKFEKGTRATAWSPYPEEFRAGSNVLITKDEVRISTPEFNVDIVDEDGETNMLSIDENGAHMQSLTAPDVTPRYAGGVVIYVNPAATAAQMESGSYYRSLADALAALSNRHLDTDVTVSIAAGMVEYGTATLTGTAGPGKITIAGRSASPAKIVGGIYMYFVNARVTIQYVNIDTTAIALQADGCMYVNASNCVFTGPGVTVTNTMAVRASLGAMVSVTNCQMYDCYRSVYGHMGGQVSATNCKGNCRAAANNSVVYISGTASCDLDSWTAGEYAGKVFTSSVTVDHGTATVPEAAPTTVEVAASATRSYTDAWRQGDTEIRQGYYSGMGEWAGCMWFATDSFAGKTIKNASITMTRKNGSGKGSAVRLTLYGITVASASGNPLTNAVSYGVIGTIDNGETKTFTLPTAAAQALANGSIKGFMLYAGDGRVMSGKSYSTNYCKIISGGNGPKLNVMY